MTTSEHGKCKQCNYDLNGDYIYDTFLEQYGNPVDALATASMYGAREGYGRWSKAIYMKEYTSEGRKLPAWFKCPNCGGMAY